MDVTHDETTSTALGHARRTFGTRRPAATTAVRLPFACKLGRVDHRLGTRKRLEDGLGQVGAVTIRANLVVDGQDVGDDDFGCHFGFDVFADGTARPAAVPAARLLFARVRGRVNDAPRRARKVRFYLAVAMFLDANIRLFARRCDGPTATAIVLTLTNRRGCIIRPGRTGDDIGRQGHFQVVARRGGTHYLFIGVVGQRGPFSFRDGGGNLLRFATIDRQGRHGAGIARYDFLTDRAKENAKVTDGHRCTT